MFELAAAVMLGAINNDDVNHVITGHEQNNTLSDLTAFRAPGWVDGPSYRGTASLLWSCFFTLSASLYTVVRPNVPTQSHKALDRARDRAFCVAMAALFPEFILRLAQEQFYQAFWLRETLNELLETSPGRRKVRDAIRRPHPYLDDSKELIFISSLDPTH